MITVIQNRFHETANISITVTHECEVAMVELKRVSKL